MTKTHYDRLGIPQDAPEEQIEAAVDQAVRELEGKKRPSQKDLDETQRLISIREVLLDSETRAQYDAALARGDLEVAAVSGSETLLFDHYSVLHGELLRGFGRGELVSVRSVGGPDLLTIEFGAGTKEIVANHPGLKPVDT